MITNSYIKKEKYFSSKQKENSAGKQSSFYDLRFSRQKISYNLSEPLNSASHGLTFKGSPVNKPPQQLITIEAALKKFGNEFGSSASEHLKETIDNLVKNPTTGVKKQDGRLNFEPQTTGQRIKDIVLYPVVKMPIDIANGVLDFAKKLPGLGNSKTINNLLDKKPLKDRRAEVKIASEVAAVQNYFEKVTEDGNFHAFKDAHGRLKPFISNYSSVNERALTRFVTGMIPAFFLANDAYNLSMYMRNNKDTAAEEKKRRFNQEAARILITTGITFGVLSFFAKKSNASGGVTNALMSGAAFVSEILGRKMAGNPVLPLGEAGAQKYADARDKKRDSKNQKVDNTPKTTGAFKGNEGKEKDYVHPPEEGALTFKNVSKVLAGLLAFGFVVDKVKATKTVSKKLSDFNKSYGSHFKKDFTISRGNFNKMTKKLEDNGFEQIAAKYQSMVKDQKGDILKIGTSKLKVKDFVVNKTLLFPIKFVWNNLLMMPYSISKKAAKAVSNAIKGEEKIKAEEKIKKANMTVEEKEKEAKEKYKKDMEMLQNSVGFLKKIDGAPQSEYKKQLNDNLLSGLDNVTKSNYSNAEMAATIKTTMSAITSGFLIADTWNMAMIDTKGKDKEIASQKAKERTIQRAARITYGLFIQQLFNNIFKKQYDGSLIGAELVNAANTLMTECVERKSVGLPLGESTKEQIIAKERANLSATGIKGDYFRAMAQLTGKKHFSERATAQKS